MFKFEKLGLNIWDDVFMNAKHLSEKARLLYCYLLTCPLSNITGVFQITNERIAFDLGFSLDDVKEAMRALMKAHKAFRAGSYVIIVDAPLYLKKRLKTVLRNFSNIIDTLPLKVKIKLHLVHYHWGDLESNIHTKKVREKVRFLGEAYVKNGKDIEAIKLLDYQEHLKEKAEAQELLKEALKTSTKKNTNKKKENKKEHKEEPLRLIDCEALNINYIDANNEALIELNLSNFISIARAVFNRNKPIIDNSSIDNIVQKKPFSNWSTPPLLLPYYATPKPIDNELGGGAFELHCEEFYDVGNEEPLIKNKEPSKSFKEPTMALPDLQEFAENARKYYINNAHRFLDHDTIDAYKKGESERRKLRAIELFREKQYNEHRLEIIEKRLLNKDNPNYNVWKDYPINWDEIKRMMGASFEDVIIACNCDDNQNNEADSTPVTEPIAEPIGEPVKEPLNAFDFDDCRNKVIMKNMSPSKQEELVAYAKAHILNSDPSFDINEWLQKKVEKIAKEEANNATKKNSNAERMSKKDSNDYRLL